MKKRFVIPVIAGLVIVILLFLSSYFETIVEETVEKVERMVSRRFSMDAQIDAGISFFPLSVSVDSFILKKKGLEALSVKSCRLENIKDLIFNDTYKLALTCDHTDADIELLYQALSSLKNKSQEKKDTKVIKKKVLEFNFNIKEFSVAYGDIREDFSLNMNFNNGEGVIRLKNSERKGSKGYVETLFSIPDSKADIRFESIELKNYSKLINEMSKVELIRGKMSGLVKLSRKDGIVRAVNDIIVSDFSLIYPLIDTEKFSIPFLRFVGDISANPAGKELTVDKARVSLGGIEGSFSGHYSTGAKSFDLDLKKVELNKLETVVRNEAFKGYLFNGYIDLEVKFRADKELGSSFSLIGDVIEPKQMSKRLNYLNIPFNYSFTDKTEKTRTFHVGPGNVDFTDLGSIPDHLKWAVLVSEDAGFYVHQGVDFKEIDAAVKDNMKKKKFRGGSTITQQLAKNLFLKREKTMIRKLREAILAVEIDATLSKRRQLEIYFNIIEWGPGIFGVSEASWYYFGKTPMELTPLESAYLASVIPGPLKYNVHFRKKKVSEKWMKRLHHILGLMNETGHLDFTDYYDALSDELIFREN